MVSFGLSRRETKPALKVGYFFRSIEEDLHPSYFEYFLYFIKNIKRANSMKHFFARNFVIFLLQEQELVLGSVHLILKVFELRHVHILTGFFNCVMKKIT